VTQIAITGREHHLLTKALAIAIEVQSRAHPRHRAGSDHDEMIELYLQLAPEAVDRQSTQHGIHWLLAGGLDLREREPDPVPIAPAPQPTPAPGGGERIAA
jgi:hypothetical protein